MNVIRLQHIISLLLIVQLAVTRLCAQQPAFHHLTVENGLSQNAVIAIGQDSRDFIWIGTSNGLNRYDGYRFKIYPSRNNDTTTPSSNGILCILGDSKKNLWAGTNNGLNKYLPGVDQFKRVPLPGNKIVTWQCLYEDKKGRVWAGTTGGLFLIHSAGTDQLQPVSLPTLADSLNNWSVRTIFEDRNGNLWVGTTQGLFKFDKSEVGSHYQFFRHNEKDPNSISGDVITSVEEDRQGNIWIGTHINGLNQYDNRTGIFKKFMHQPTGNGIINNNIRKLLVDKEGRIWVGTQEGISVLNDQGNTLFTFQQNDEQAESLSQNSVHSLFQDAVGNIWAGTYFGGVNYTYALNTQFYVLRKKDKPNYLNNNVISSIVEDEKKNLWIGTEGGGLNYFDRHTGNFQTYRQTSSVGSIGSNLVKYVYRDWQGQIWAGTHGGGLNLFDPARQSFKKFLFRENDPLSLNQEIRSIYEDSKARLWVSTTFGTKLFNKILQGLDPIDNAFTKKAPFNFTASSFLEDDKKRLWVSTTDGLYVLEGEQFRKLSGDIVNCMLQNKSSQVWFGIEQGGLARFDEKTQALVYYNQPDKIGNRNILGILEDEQQNLWLSSDKGLLKYNPRQEQLQVFTVSDGLAGNAFNYNSFFKDSHGEFFFGGFNGITHFFPEKIQSNQKAATILLTGLRVFDLEVTPNDSTAVLSQSMTGLPDLTLKHNQDVITLEFALLNYIKSNKNLYAYKLDGYDKDWVYSNTPAASYTNLPSGNFTFQVKGANNDGVWSDTVSLNIHLLPPFWLTWWAYSLYVLASLGLVFFVLRYFFLGALLKKEEEMHQVKLNFFTNISHEIRTHLTLIMAPVERMMDARETNVFTIQQLGAVRQNANRLLKLVSELMDFRKAETGNLKLTVQEHDFYPFLEDVFNSFRDISVKKEIATSLIYDGDQLPLFFDKEQLEKVFFNIIANAFKFTPQHGRIWIQVVEKTDEVLIKIIDNGRGIAPEYLDKVFTNFFQVDDHGIQNTGYGIGLALAKTIVLLHKGNITVQSEPGTAGDADKTVFVVTLLKGTKHFTPDQVKDQREIQAEEKTTYQAVSKVAAVVTDNYKSQVNLLIIEDNTELRALLRDTFSGKYSIHEASDGAEGLAMATNLIPDIIISDVMMPVMDGLELCERLKTDERTSHIPVILLTAKSTQSDQVSGLETGADMYLTKPFSTRILELNVRNLLAAREKLRMIFMQQLNQYSKAAAETPGKIDGINAVEQEFLQRVIKIVEENFENPEFGVDMLSRKVAMSTPVLYKKIKAVSKMSVNDFIKSLRLKKAAQLLSERQMTVYEVAYSVGYNDLKYFRQEFKKQFDKTPSEYARDSTLPG